MTSTCIAVCRMIQGVLKCHFRFLSPVVETEGRVQPISEHVNRSNKLKRIQFQIY